MSVPTSAAAPVSSFARSFGGQAAVPAALAANTAPSKKDLPKAQFWLNFGYVAEFQTDDGVTHQSFVSLAQGIPLDTLAALPTNSQNGSYQALQLARNAFQENLMEFANTMKPGQEQILCLDAGNGLGVQLRRVNEEGGIKITPDQNPLIKKFDFTK